MLTIAIIFAFIALTALALRFVGIEAALDWVAKTIVFVFVAVFILSLIFGNRRE